MLCSKGGCSKRLMSGQHVNVSGKGGTCEGAVHRVCIVQIVLSTLWWWCGLYNNALPLTVAPGECPASCVCGLLGCSWWYAHSLWWTALYSGHEGMRGEAPSAWSVWMKARVSSDVGRASVMGGQQDRRGYCFEGITGAAEAAVAAVEQQGGWWLRPGWDENGTGACAGVALLSPHVTDQFTHGAQRG